MTRLILSFLLIIAVSCQSEEFLRLKQELEDHIAVLRPEAREVAEKLKSVFEARLPKEEAKKRLNAVMESASATAKAALDTLKPDHKIDVEVVIDLPFDDTEGQRLIDHLTVPGLDFIASAIDRFNLTDKTLWDARRAHPDLASRLGVDGKVMDRIENLAIERGIANYSIDNVVQILRHNLSSLLTSDERFTLEKCATARNLTSIEQLFEGRFGAPDRSGKDITTIIRDRIGNFSEMGDKFWSNLTGDFENFGNGSIKTLIDGFKAGNFSMLERFFNGSANSTGDGTIDKIVNIFKSGTLSAFLPSGAGSNSSSILDTIKGMFYGTSSNSNGIVDKIKSLFNITLPSGSGSSGIIDKVKDVLPSSSGGSSSNTLTAAMKNMGINVPDTSSLKNLFS